MTTTPPHAKWEPWATALRQLREQAGHTQAVLGSKTLIARSTVSALERCELAPNREQSETLDRFLASGGVLTRLWDDLFRGANLPEWWQNALGLELRSEEIWEYEPNVIPGLLQTKDYAREMLGGASPRAKPEEIDELVGKRTGRLQSLRDRAEGMPVIRFIIGERALTPAAIHGALMVEQLDWLLTLMSEPMVEIRILTADATPLYASLPFRINTMSNTRRVAHFEHRNGGVTKDDPALVAELNTAFGTLAMEALPSRQSMTLISEVRAQWNGANPATAQAPETVSKSPQTGTSQVTAQTPGTASKSPNQSAE